MMARPSRLFERAFKIRFGLKLCLLTLLGGAAVVLLLYLSLARSLGPSYGSAIYTIYELKIKIAPLIFASSYSVLILAVITAAIALISVLFSHRIAGPLYRVEKSLEAISSGDLTVNTRFRGLDQLTILGDDLNNMVRSLNHTSRSVMDAIEDIKAAEDRLRELLEIEGSHEGAIRAAAQDLRAGIDELKKALAHLKVKE